MNLSVRRLCHPCFAPCSNKSTNPCKHAVTHKCRRSRGSEADETILSFPFSCCHTKSFLTLLSASRCDPAFFYFSSFFCLTANICHELSLTLVLSLSPSGFLLNPRILCSLTHSPFHLSLPPPNRLVFCTLL